MFKAINPSWNVTLLSHALSTNNTQNNVLRVQDGDLDGLCRVLRDNGVDYSVTAPDTGNLFNLPGSAA